MRFDEVNAIVDSVFTNEEIDAIYTAIGEPTYEMFMHRYGQEVKDFRMPQAINDKIVKMCKALSGYDNLELEAYQFARYTDNDTTKPNLVPHWDSFETPRFTFDIQLRSNTDWTLFVEDKEFVLKDNQALTFSGTHQIHWREKKQFLEGEFMDMIFCHLHIPNDTRSIKDTALIMEEKETHFTQKYNERYSA